MDVMGLRKQLINTSPVAGKYETLQDRRSAYEILKQRADQAASEAAVAEEREEDLALPPLWVK